MQKQILKIFFLLAIFFVLAPFAIAAVPPQFANLTSCQLSTNPSVLTSTCSNVQAPNVAMPALFDGTDATKYDSSFGAKYFRITTSSDVTTENPLITSMYPDYSKVPAWNANGTVLLLTDNKGFWHLYNGNTYQRIRRLNHPANYVFDGQDMEPRWSHTDPNKFYYRANMGFYSYSVVSNTSTLIHNFTNAELGTTDCATIKNGDEGNPDDTDRYWAYVCQTDSSGGYTQRAIFTYDMQTDAVISSKLLTAGGICGAGACPTTANNVGMSHSGNYVVVEWNTSPANHLRTPNTLTGKGTEAFDRSLNFVSQPAETYNHFDLAALADGTDVSICGADQVYYPDGSMSANGYKAIRVVRLSDGQILRSCMMPVSQYSHTSGRTDNAKFKGWILYSTYDQTGAGIGIDSDGGIFAVENFALNIDTCEVRRIAHTQSNWSPDNYFSEPHASMNFDFTKIIWGSNWRNQSGDVQTYVSELSSSSPSDATAPSAPSGLSVT